MQFQPIRALITREQDGKPMHEALRDVPAVVPVEPQVGLPLQIFLDSGKVMRTTAVQHVSRSDSELVIDTANSRYHLKLSNAA